LAEPTADPLKIKRAYQKRAMRYHPDVVLTTKLTAKERDKASKDFTRINTAYKMLTGGWETAAGSATGGGGGAVSLSGGYTTYQPLHRRRSGYSSP
jgi:DnaJ-class molecular chaperone